MWWTTSAIYGQFTVDFWYWGWSDTAQTWSRIRKQVSPFNFTRNNWIHWPLSDMEKNPGVDGTIRIANIAPGKKWTKFLIAICIADRRLFGVTFHIGWRPSTFTSGQLHHSSSTLKMEALLNLITSWMIQRFRALEVSFPLAMKMISILRTALCVLT